MIKDFTFSCDEIEMGDELILPPRVINGNVPTPRSYFTHSKSVKELTDKDFNAKGELKNKQCHFILFYKPDCWHCEKIKKKWSALAEIVAFYSVCAFNVELYGNSVAYKKADKYIDGYPTCIIYNNGKLKKIYDDENTVDKMLLFLMDQCQ